ncbi:MAG: hypothetical protein JWP69_357 [Flaviaesturariibacter sp.]|nr:hypothetical protein [Flaviaesturariibacter sp.]
MEFGKVSTAALEITDFALPPEPKLNQAILTGVKAPITKLFVGASQWGVKEWVGKIYPKGTPATRFLDEYVKNFNSIELNATHYKIYPPETIQKWAERAADKHFRFCPKLFQEITHKGALKDHDNLLYAFLQSAEAFGEHLGSIFMQLPEWFGPERQTELYDFLEALPPGTDFFIEVRHKDWFLEPQQTELFRTLQDLNVGAVITDVAGRRDCCHMQLTVKKALIRFVANSLHPTDYTRIDAWAERIRYWLDNGLQEVYFMLHVQDETFTPELSIYATERLNEVCRLNLPVPVWKAPPELF